MKRTQKRQPNFEPRKRQPLTAKAIGAICAFAQEKTTKMPTVNRVVKVTLQAEKMDRETLYTWLRKRGYEWCSDVQYWVPNFRPAKKAPVPKEKARVDCFNPGSSLASQPPLEERN